MKNYFLMISLLLLVANVWAQSKPVKIVFDITSKEEVAHQTTMRHVKMMSAAYPDSEFEVVVYGGACPMVVKEKSSVSEDIKELADNKQVTIIVCEATLQRYEINKSQLLTGVKTVPDGILEIVTKQSEGWGYIKESND